MHGVVFQEFLSYAENATSTGFVEDMIAETRLPSGGAYTSDARYPHEELETLVGFMADRTGERPSALLRDFGRKMFVRFAHMHPEIFREQPDGAQFLETLHAHIHERLQAEDPAIQPPMLDCERQVGGGLLLKYRSHRPLADLCHGLIEATVAHFDLPGEIRVERLDDEGRAADFHIAI